MKDPALKETMIAWMPKSMAGSGEQAQEKLKAVVYSAFPRRTDGYRLKFYNNKYGVSVQFINGSSCTETYLCSIGFNFQKPLMVKAKPNWAGSGPAYVWTNWQRGQGSYDQFHNVNVILDRQNLEPGEPIPWPKALNPSAYLAALSANLPKWVYIYLPPSDERSYPVMLNQGKQLLFIEPTSAGSEEDKI